MTDMERVNQIMLEAKFCSAKAQLLIAELAGMVARRNTALAEIEAEFKNKNAGLMSQAERKVYGIAQRGLG